MFRAFADVQTAEMLDLPRPQLSRAASRRSSPARCRRSSARFRSELVARYERIRSQKVDPREDNALAITTDGRKLALDARLVSARRPEFPESKINALVENGSRTSGDATEETRGTQMIFCDLGVNPTPWGYSVYEEIDREARRRRHPPRADRRHRRRRLATPRSRPSSSRSGRARSACSSAARRRWAPAPTCRSGSWPCITSTPRGSRPRSSSGRAASSGRATRTRRSSIYRYVTEGSFDAYMWQALETKARFIAQVMTGESGRPAGRGHRRPGALLRRGEGHRLGQPGGPDARRGRRRACSGSRPLKKNHADEQYLARRNVRELPEAIARLEEAARRAHGRPGDGPGPRARPGDHRRGRLPAREAPRRPRRVPRCAYRPRSGRPAGSSLGRMRGLTFGIVKHRFSSPEVFLEGRGERQAQLSRESQGPRACLERPGAALREL